MIRKRVAATASFWGRFDRAALGFAIALLAFFAVDAWKHSGGQPVPVDILSIEPDHPIIAGQRVSLQMTALVRRRCAASASLSMIDSAGRRVWVHAAPNVGYTEPGAKPRVIQIRPATPLPADLPDGEYTLVYNRTDYCPERQYVHEPRVYETTIP